MVIFYKCGHGDCALINDTFNIPGGGSEHVRLYIDLGPSSFNVPYPFPADTDVDILISHSDGDHCLGKATSINPRRIFVPAFYLEMRAILKKLSTHGNLSVSLSSALAKKFIPVDDSRPLVYSNNIQWVVFNPQRSLWKNWLVGINLPSKDVMQHDVDDFLKENHIDADVDGMKELVFQAQNFYSDDVAKVDGAELEDFVLAALYKIYKYAQSRSGTLKRAIGHFKHYCVNSYSIVFKYVDSSGNTFLFTGDAPASVYTRKKNILKNINADVLKVPHHGSASGFDIKNIQSQKPSKVLNVIDPKIMVVSHGDYASGPPHMDVIRFLDQQRQSGKILCLTEDIVQNNNLNKPQESYQGVAIPSKIRAYNIEFRDK